MGFVEVKDINDIRVVSRHKVTVCINEYEVLCTLKVLVRTL